VEGKKILEQHSLVDQVEPARANESIKVIAKEGSTARPTAPGEVRTYTEEDHLARASESTKELYERLKERICSWEKYRLRLQGTT